MLACVAKPRDKREIRMRFRDNILSLRIVLMTEEREHKVTEVTVDDVNYI